MDFSDSDSSPVKKKAPVKRPAKKKAFSDSEDSDSFAPKKKAAKVKLFI